MTAPVRHVGGVGYIPRPAPVPAPEPEEPRAIPSAIAALDVLTARSATVESLIMAMLGGDAATATELDRGIVLAGRLQHAARTMSDSLAARRDARQIAAEHGDDFPTLHMNLIGGPWG